ncbi:MAG TPA: UxaA family hydrolase, partial [Terriglobales bacterium]|nr:UxaA family hydrolase [Terriglobales bacterium]
MLKSIVNAPLIILSSEDNVAVARVEIAPGTALDGYAVTARDKIPQGHKMALRLITQGEVVRKYGQVIGYASSDIAPGAHVHTQNVEMRDVALAHDFCVDARPP